MADVTVSEWLDVMFVMVDVDMKHVVAGFRYMHMWTCHRVSWCS